MCAAIDGQRSRLTARRTSPIANGRVNLPYGWLVLGINTTTIWKGNRYAEKIQTEEISLRGIPGSGKISFSYFFQKMPKRCTYITQQRGKNTLAERKNAFFGKSLIFPRKQGVEKYAEEKGEITMKSNNQINVPQAKAAMEQFKMQAAQEVGVNLTNGYNGHLTSREAGSVGGQMVKKNCPIRLLTFHRANRIAQGHQVAIQYAAHIGV